MPRKGGRRAVGLEDPDDLRPGGGQAGCDGQQEGAGAGYRDLGPSHDSLALEQSLGTAGGEHPRQGPSGKGELAIVGTGRDDHGAGEDLPQAVFGGRVDAKGAVGQHFHLPDRMTGEMHDPVGVLLEGAPQPGESRPPGVVAAVVVIAVAPVLATDPPAGVDEGHAGALRGSGSGGGETSRAGAEHGHLEDLAGGGNVRR